MKKIYYIVLLLVLSIFISGCSVDYKLDMSKEGINEDITIEFSKKECNDGEGNCEEYARNLLNSVIETEGYPNYSFTYTDKGSDALVKLSYSYASLSDFKKNNIYKSSYNNIEIDENTFILSSSTDSYESPLNTKYKVTIIPSKKIKRSNVTRKEGNKYIWEFTSSDKNKDIKFSYKKAGKLSDETNNNSEINTLVFIIIVIVIFAIVAVIIGYYNSKSKRVNKL